MGRERKFTKQELYLITKRTLLDHGYEGFTFSIIAGKLNISRGTLYKYYEKKEELITEYMVYEMKQFLDELQRINEINDFEAQFDYLLHIIFKDKEIHQIREIAFHIPASINEKVANHIAELEKLHRDMYVLLQDFVDLGKKKKKLKQHLPDSLLLGFIFQTIAIPNHFHIPEQEWLSSLREILIDGMFIN